MGSGFSADSPEATLTPGNWSNFIGFPFIFAEPVIFSSVIVSPRFREILKRWKIYPRNSFTLIPELLYLRRKKVLASQGNFL
jgi:hypothetical protein